MVSSIPGTVRPVLPEPFAVDVQRRDDVAVVLPRGELDVATADTLRAALERVDGAAHLVLDLRGLSFIDSTGLHMLAALHERAQREGFRLTLVAPPAPVDRAIRVSGLGEALPFAAADDVGDGKPRETPIAVSTTGRRGAS
jgi:anti-sigma B factor antagonist